MHEDEIGLFAFQERRKIRHDLEHNVL